MESATVEQEQEQESAETVTVEEEGQTVSVEEQVMDEKDPTEKLKTVLEQKLELEGLENRMREQRLLIQAEEDALRHKLASSLVDSFFLRLGEFSKQFTEGEVFRQYQEIQHHIGKIREHDPSFPKSLSEGKYSVEIGQEEHLFWMNMLQKFIATDEPLDRFLRGVFGTKVHGTPFETKT